jgi:hypothetical protein
MKNLEIKQHSKQAIIQFSIYDFKMLKTLGKNFSMTFMSLLPKAAQSYLQKYYNKQPNARNVAIGQLIDKRDLDLLK